MPEDRIFMYSCPDCGFLSRGDEIHQHQDVEWVKGQDIRLFYRLIRWIEGSKEMKVKMLIDFDAIELERFVRARTGGYTFWVMDWVKALFSDWERIEIKEIRIVER